MRFPPTNSEKTSENVDLLVFSLGGQVLMYNPIADLCASTPASSWLMKGELCVCLR